MDLKRPQVNISYHLKVWDKNYCYYYFLRKLILLFSMDALNGSEMTVKTFVISKTVVYIDNKKKCDNICDTEQRSNGF